MGAVPGVRAVASGELTSSNQVHRQLVRWLEIYGRRTDNEEAATPAPDTDDDG
jgi:ribosome-binding protein aMBF1 (putative translation factor)